MKHYPTKSIFVAILALAIIMVGCKKPKEQSSVSIDDFKQTAKIVGKLTYDEGQSFDGTKYERLIKPAADVKITAIIANSEFSSTANGSGNLTYSTKTDAEGNYEISVPVTNSGVTVKVKIASFTGKYHNIIDIEDGKPKYSSSEVVYKLEGKSFTLDPNDVEVFDGVFTKEERIDTDEYTDYSEYQVVVGMSSYTKGVDESNNPIVIKQYEEASNVDVIISVNYEGETFKYVATTDKEGIATFSIPTKTLNWTPIITIKANPFQDDNFDYFKIETDEETGEATTVRYKLSGYFEQVSGFEDEPDFNSVEDMPAPQRRVKMNFISTDDENYGYDEEFWGDVEF